EHFHDDDGVLEAERSRNATDVEFEDFLLDFCGQIARIVPAEIATSPIRGRVVGKGCRQGSEVHRPPEPVNTFARGPGNALGKPLSLGELRGREVLGSMQNDPGDAIAEMPPLGANELFVQRLDLVVGNANAPLHAKLKELSLEDLAPNLLAILL